LVTVRWRADGQRTSMTGCFSGAFVFSCLPLFARLNVNAQLACPFREEPNLGCLVLQIVVASLLRKQGGGFVVDVRELIDEMSGGTCFARIVANKEGEDHTKIVQHSGIFPQVACEVSRPSAIISPFAGDTDFRAEKADC
jgi:hypothetical protein